MKPMVAFEHISKSFPGVKALSDISFSIERGEVHAIVGENGAGKSTLMNLLGGLFSPTEGAIFFEGAEVAIPNEQASLGMGIGIVYQELRLCPNLTIAENLFLGRELHDGHRLDWKCMKERSKKVLCDLGMDLSPDALVRSLSIAEQQIVEIAKSLTRDIKVLVLDEPTSALTIRESENLFTNIRKLKDEGVTIIYISHRLEEIMELSDHITVLRDGEYKGTFETGSVQIDDLVRLIAGKKLIEVLERGDQTSERNGVSSEVILSLRNLESADGKVRNVSFELHKGEVLGIYGVQGAGRTELLETIFGIRKRGSGEMLFGSETLENKSPAQAIKNGFAMVPEDRRQIGIFPNMNILENINISNKNDISSPGGLLHKRRMVKISDHYREEVGIKAKDIYQNITHLSGGNQQKVVISRWLATNPKVLLVDELTRGVDVGAKAEIFSVLRMLRSRGLGIIMVSSELQEVIAESDRVLVMKNGAMVKELTGKAIDKDNIIRYALVG
ncbi:sugar ABC transporter ATP-binding protein [Sediminispirochaeta smaragdinae]|uniref:ABC transporter related protein n=1 Tax=Sediminispirochaeta smaragdinae (strain DSM 11293 / JCM 15392 / SEBR 4228) TaxID=573413 RepID=E1R151_SEDSS|nr:sugar ABC transporter ATP-binding protein [Sediminispirochaeta smaragdinae]ADK80300.1 ABC transporter related protein [Sediminispirochaeta smaragdinae DSM 11293]